MSGSWVTKMTVMPCSRLRRWKIAMISTLVRLSQALGYQGFSDLQQVFRSRLKDRVLNYDERLKHLRAHAAAGSRAGSAGVVLGA